MLFVEVVPGSVTVMVVTQSVLVLDCARAKQASLATKKNSSDLMLNISEWLK